MKQRNLLFVFLALLVVLSGLLIWLGRRAEPQPDPTDSGQAALPTGTTQNATAPDDWQLTLVNPWHPMAEGYVPELAQVENGYQVDTRCADALEAMLADCRAAGLSPLICSAYRTQEKQTTLYNNLVNKLLAQGYTQADAEAKAGTEVARPGTSEHQLGLAVDIVDQSYQVLDQAQEDTAVQQWLMAHCWEYGFILRYPTDKSDVTGIIYEPWHYRYVGEDYAQEIQASGLCLEEYLAASMV